MEERQVLHISLQILLGLHFAIRNHWSEDKSSTEILSLRMVSGAVD